LDADLVILSVCSMAASNGDALSGVARAFFYAQARALLVSHWAVDSSAAVKLITTAVGQISKDKTVAYAEALRRAMLRFIDTGDPHPACSAPFALVGEGGRMRR
jgi:CHAT domain-containing protein